MPTGREVGRDVGGVLGHRHRLPEVDLLPAGARFATEGRARQQLAALTPEIAIESTRLPGELHRDPADQIIVATARVYGCPLVTSDEKILNYPHVTTIR